MRQYPTHAYRSNPIKRPNIKTITASVTQSVIVRNQFLTPSLLDMDLKFSSRERNAAANETRSKFTVDMLWNQLVGSNAVPPEGYSVKVVGMTIPHTFYGINDNNNVVLFVANSVNYAITIPVGTYNAADLAAYLQTTMNSIAASESQVFTVTFDDTNGLFTFTKTSGTGSWNFETGPLAVAATEASPATAGTFSFTAYRALGFSTPDSGTAITASTANGTGVDSTKFVNMLPTNEVNLAVNWPGVRSYDTRTHGHNQIMATVGVRDLFGNLFSLDPNTTTEFRSYETPPHLEIILQDDDGAELSLNGADFDFKIRILGLEGMTPMTNMMETKHDSRHQTARYNIHATAMPTIPAGNRDAPNRAWQGHANATSIQQGVHASLNPVRRNNPFMNPL